ncbi:MAG: hypothetical protein ABIK89_20960 [Planctomycetota bacterium]
MEPPSELAETLAQQRRVAEARGIAGLGRHVFLCCDQADPECSTKE